MTKLLSIIFIFLTSISIFSQESKKFDYELLGVLVLESNDILSYKIIFNVDENKNILGYSFTDMSGENETKSYIKGKYDKKSKEFNFYEEDVLYTKSKFLPEDFCFVDFKGKFKVKKNKKILDGKFVGIYNDKDTCATGRVKLVGTKFTEKKLNKIYKKIKKKKKIDSIVKEQFKPETYLKKFSETKIKSGERVSVFIYNPNMKMEIWDYGKEDGDVISVNVNDKSVLKNYIVKKEKEKIILNLKEGSNLVKITTINSGKLETNTTKIKIYDFMREYEIISDLRVGKSAYINIIKLDSKKSKRIKNKIKK